MPADLIDQFGMRPMTVVLHLQADREWPSGQRIHCLRVDIRFHYRWEGKNVFQIRMEESRRVTLAAAQRRSGAAKRRKFCEFDHLLSSPCRCESFLWLPVFAACAAPPRDCS
jgi:hypothetical protein